MEVLSLRSILEAFHSPLSEEQAWAVCFQCAKHLENQWSQYGAGECFCFNGVGSLMLCKDGTVAEIQGNSERALTEYELVQSLGVVIYQALDYGLADTEEQKLSPPLEQLIEKMTDSESDDEGKKNGHTRIDVDGDEGIENDTDDEFYEPTQRSTRIDLPGVIMMCTAHLSAGLEPSSHYKAVCRALTTEATELLTFLEKISKEKEKLKQEQILDQQDGAQLDELQRSDWARFWIQVMRELRKGVKLKKIDHESLNPYEYELTPYEMLMEDIRSRRYTLNKVTIDGDIPPNTKKDAHTIILDFIRSRPPLHPVKDRKLNSPPPRTPDPREQLLEAIRSEPKLKPTPGRIVETSRTKLNEEDATPYMTRKVIKPDASLLLSNSFEEDDDEEDEDEVDDDEDVFKSPIEDQKRLAVEPSMLSPLTPLCPTLDTPVQTHWQRKAECPVLPRMPLTHY